MQSPFQSHRHRRYPSPRKNRRQIRRLPSLNANPLFTINLKIHYFALLRDQRRLDSETLSTTATNPAELYAQLAAQHHFTLPQTALQVAINDDFATWTTPLSPGDTLAFIPPVAGG